MAFSWQDNWQSSSLTGQLKPALNSQGISTKVGIFILDPFHLFLWSMTPLALGCTLQL